MTQEQFRADFEAVAPQMLAVAHDVAGRSDDVRTLWIYVTNEEGASTVAAYYRVAAGIIQAHELADHVPGVDSDAATVVADLLRPLMALKSQLYASAPTGGDDVPTRVVIRYDVAAQQMDADMHYGPLQPGVAPDDHVDVGTLQRQWFRRLVESDGVVIGDFRGT